MLSSCNAGSLTFCLSTWFNLLCLYAVHRFMLAVLQDILDTFYQWRDRGQDKVSLVLRNSYQQLPRKAHRSMFLDAALMMLDRPVAHLIAVWQGELLLDPRFCARKASSSYLSWQNNRRKASAMRATQLFEYLKGVSLIKATDGMETPTPDDQTGGPSGRSVGPPRCATRGSIPMTLLVTCPCSSTRCMLLLQW